MATMKDIIQSPLLPALFGSMALGLFASSASGSKVVKGGIKGVLPVLIIMTVLSLAARLAGYGSVLGGLVGIGTLICAFCLGPFIQFFNGLVSERVLHYKPGGQ